MTVTYDLSTVVGKIRLIIGDNDIVPVGDAVFSDEELTYFYTAEGSVNLGAAAALVAWAAKYATSADSEGMGDYRYTQKSVDHMMTLAAKLRETADGYPVFDISSMDLTAGSAITAEED